MVTSKNQRGTIRSQRGPRRAGVATTRLAMPTRKQRHMVMGVLSHAHADHIGGLTEENGTARRLLFPNARHVIARAEFGYWTSSRASVDHAWMADLARLHLLPAGRAGMLDLVAGEQDIAPGIRVIPAPGHTPGHMAVSISADTQQAVFAADAAPARPVVSIGSDLAKSPLIHCILQAQGLPLRTEGALALLSLGYEQSEANLGYVGRSLARRVAWAVDLLNSPPHAFRLGRSTRSRRASCTSPCTRTAWRFLGVRPPAAGAISEPATSG